MKDLDNVWGRDQIMVIAAVRYCMGRSTYIVGDCAEWLIVQWPHFNEHTKAIIQRDLEEEFDPRGKGFQVVK